MFNKNQHTNISIVLLIGITLFLSGCVEEKIVPNQTKLSDVDIVNAFCKSKGYDYGRTEIQDPFGYYEYKKTMINPSFDYDNFNREIICTKVVTKKTDIVYDYNDLFNWLYK